MLRPIGLPANYREDTCCLTCGYITCDCLEKARREAKARRERDIEEAVERLVRLRERRQAERAVQAEARRRGTPVELIAQYNPSLNCTEKPFPTNHGICAGCGFKCKECVC